jgi:hypothetical protein
MGASKMGEVGRVEAGVVKIMAGKMGMIRVILATVHGHRGCRESVFSPSATFDAARS